MSLINTSVTTRTSSRPDSGVLPALSRAVVRAADTLATWQERRRQRRALETLPDHLLNDIGVSRADAGYEADKPFWQG